MYSSTNLCCCCWAVWGRMCRWIAHADRQPAPARTRALWPPQTSSSRSTWGRWWWKERIQTLDSRRWRSRRRALPSPSSWTVGSGRGRLHRAIKIMNRNNRWAHECIWFYISHAVFPYRILVVSGFVALVINMVVLFLQIELDPVMKTHHLLAILGFSYKHMFKSTGILPVMEKKHINMCCKLLPSLTSQLFIFIWPQTKANVWRVHVPAFIHTLTNSKTVFISSFGLLANKK